MKIATIGLDLAKTDFQLHAVDTEGRVVLRRRLRRSEVVKFFARLSPCLVGMEACAGAHHWARTIAGLGHEVRLMPPAYVKAYVRRQKNDMADAAAICEAVTRPSMRFVPIKSEQQQALLLIHRARDLLVRQRTSLINALRAHLAEFGVVRPKGGHNGRKLSSMLLAGETFGMAAPVVAGAARHGTSLPGARGGDRPARARAAPARGGGRGGAASGEDSGRRPDHRDRSGRDRRRPSQFPLVTRVRGLAGPSPAPELLGGHERLGGITKMGHAPCDRA
jgi:transposase